MSISRGPSINTNSLITYLDGANYLSNPGSGTIWRNLISSSNSSSLVNGASFTSSNAGGCVNFAGDDDVVVLANKDVYNFERSSSFSISMWVNLSTINGAADQIFMSKLGDPNTYIGWEFGKVATNNSIHVYIIGNFTSVALEKKGATALQANTWYNVAVTYNGNYSASGIQLYLNGVPDTPYTASLDNYLTSTITNTKDVHVGARPSWVSPFSGKMSIIQIYNRVLFPEEVLRNYNTLKSRFGL